MDLHLTTSARKKQAGANKQLYTKPCADSFGSGTGVELLYCVQKVKTYLKNRREAAIKQESGKRGLHQNLCSSISGSNFMAKIKVPAFHVNANYLTAAIIHTDWQKYTKSNAVVNHRVHICRNSSGP